MSPKVLSHAPTDVETNADGVIETIDTELQHDERGAWEVRRDDRRAHPRYQYRRPLIAIPLLPDGTPDRNRQMVGESIDLSEGGIALDLGVDRALQENALLVGMREPSGAIRYVGVEVRRAETVNDEQLRVGAQFGGVGSQILQSGAQLPIWDPLSMRFTLQQPEELMRAWVDAGIFDRVFVDRVQVCPKCSGLPTFRHGCRSCGSARVSSDRLIHHYACAHVGLLTDFETSEGLICPKCRTRWLVVGSDYEFLSGPYRCHDCGWSDTELEYVAHCLRCAHRFAAHKAGVQEVYGYRANALSVVDCLPAPSQGSSTVQLGN